MIQKLSVKLTTRMVRENVINIQQTKVYVYGMELLLSSVFGIIALCIVSIVGHNPFGWIPYLVGFVPIRITGGGYHAKSHIMCILLFTAIYICVFCICDYISGYAWAILSAINVIIVFLHSPVEAKNKPLNKRQQMLCRRASIAFSCLALAIASLFLLVYEKTPLFFALYYSGCFMSGLSQYIAVLLNAIKKKKSKNMYVR